MRRKARVRALLEDDVRTYADGPYGAAEPAHDPGGTLGFYYPDLSRRSGWRWRSVEPAELPRDPRIGFGRAR